MDGLQQEAQAPPRAWHPSVSFVARPPLPWRAPPARFSTPFRREQKDFHEMKLKHRPSHPQRPVSGGVGGGSGGAARRAPAAPRRQRYSVASYNILAGGMLFLCPIVTPAGGRRAAGGRSCCSTPARSLAHNHPPRANHPHRRADKYAMQYRHFLYAEVRPGFTGRRVAQQITRAVGRPPRQYRRSNPPPRRQHPPPARRADVAPAPRCPTPTSAGATAGAPSWGSWPSSCLT